MPKKKYLPEKITATYLRSLNACNEAIHDFTCLYPRGVRTAKLIENFAEALQGLPRNSGYLKLLNFMQYADWLFNTLDLRIPRKLQLADNKFTWASPGKALYLYTSAERVDIFRALLPPEDKEKPNVSRKSDKR